VLKQAVLEPSQISINVDVVVEVTHLEITLKPLNFAFRPRKRQRR
jgi:hypothetical protein